MDLAHNTDANFASVKQLLLKIRELSQPGAGPITPAQAEQFLLEFQCIFVSYTLATAPARARLNEPRTHESAVGELKMAITRNDYPGEIRALLGRLRRLLEPDHSVPRTGAPKASEKKAGRKKAQPAISSLLDHLDMLYRRVGGVSSLNEAQATREAADAASRAVEFVDCDTCFDCAATLVLESGGAEGRCPECHRVFELHGVVYEDAQLFSLEGQRGKSGQFNPNRHFNKWLVHILALEPETEIGDPADPDNLTGEKLIETLRKEAHRLNMHTHLLDVTKIRKLLHSIERSELNQNASLILKKLTGLEPPTLSEEKRVKGGLKFSQVLQALSTLGMAGNRNYYPYYIYKIYDLVLDEDDPDRFMLWFIHMQGATTLGNNDFEWRKICDVLEWEARPTDLVKVTRYRSLYGKVGR